MKTDTQIKWRALKVGLVVTIALFLLLWAVVNSDALNHLITQNSSLFVRVPAVNGLRDGAPVWLQGIEIGSVHSLALRPDGVVIRLAVRRSALSIVRKDAEASISTMGLLGDKFVELSRGTIGNPFLRNGDTLRGKMEAGLDQILEASIGSARLVEEFLRKVDTIAANAESGKGVIGALLTDTILFHRINDIVDIIARNAREYDTGRGTVKKLLTDESMYRTMVEAVSVIDSLGLRIKSGAGTMGRFINDSSIYVNLDRSLVHLQTIEDTVSAFAASFKAFPKERIATSFLKTIDQLKELLKDIKDNPSRYFKIKIF